MSDSCNINPAFVGIETSQFSASAADASDRDFTDSCIFNGKQIIGSNWCLVRNVIEKLSGGAPIDTNKPLVLSIVSTAENQIAIHNSRKRTVTKSWTIRVGKNSSLTVPAVSIYGTDKFVVVQNSNKLLSWSLEHENVTDGKKATVSKSFTTILSSKQLAGHFLGIHTDGSVGLYNTQLKEVSSFGEDSANGEIIHQELVSRNRACYLFMVVRVDGLNYIRFLQVECSENKDKGFSVIADHEIEHKSEILSVSCHSRISATQDFAVACLFSDGNLQFLKFVGGSSNFSLAPKVISVVHLGNQISATKERSSKRKKTTKSKQQSNMLEQVHLTCLVDSYFAISTPQMDGLDASISLWDSNFGVIMTQLNFSSHQTIESMVQCDFSNTFLTTTGTSVHVFNISCPKPSLAAAIGRLKETNAFISKHSNAPETNDPVLFANVDVTPCIKDSSSGMDSWENYVEEINSKEEKVIAKLSSVKETPNEKEFEKLFFEYVEGTSETKSNKKRKRKKDAEETIQPTNLSHALTTTVVNRCCQDGFWSPVNWLVEKGAASCNTTPKLLAWLLHHRQLDILYKCFRLVPDISEKALVDCIVYVTSVVKDKDLEKLDKSILSKAESLAKSEKPKKKARGLNKAYAQRSSNDWIKLAKKTLWGGLTKVERGVLNTILAICAAPQNDVFLKTQVKRLSIAQVEVVLGCLCRVLSCFDFCPSKYTSPKTTLESLGIHLPSRVQVISWMCTLLDAHFQQLVLDSLKNEGLKTLLTRVQRLVSREMSLCEGMQTLRQPLEYLVSGHQVVHETALGEYTIEQLVL